jgi:hypothetical protein
MALRLVEADDPSAGVNSEESGAVFTSHGAVWRGEEVAEHTESMLQGLHKLAVAQGFTVLAILLDIARQEAAALRNSSPG